MHVGSGEDRLVSAPATKHRLNNSKRNQCLFRTKLVVPIPPYSESSSQDVYIMMTALDIKKTTYFEYATTWRLQWFTYLFTLFSYFTYLFIYLLCLLTYNVYLPTYLITLLTYLPTYSLTYLLTYLVLTYLFTYLRNYFILFTYLPTYLLTHSLTLSLTHSLTPCNRVLLEKLTGFQLVKKFAAFYGA
jgi:hypothetical protein